MLAGAFEGTAIWTPGSRRSTTPAGEAPGPSASALRGFRRVGGRRARFRGPLVVEQGGADDALEIGLVLGAEANLDVGTVVVLLDRDEAELDELEQPAEGADQGLAALLGLDVDEQVAQGHRPDLADPAREGVDVEAQRPRVAGDLVRAP